MNDDQTRSPAAERMRRREEMRATIIMAAAYKGVGRFRQPHAVAGKGDPPQSHSPDGELKGGEAFAGEIKHRMDAPPAVLLARSPPSLGNRLGVD
jgi:hypothetical protein